MIDEAPGEEAAVELGVRFTGIDNDGQPGIFVEPHSSPQSAEGRCAMYRRNGDTAAEVVTRTVTTRWSAWNRMAALPADERT